MDTMITREEVEERAARANVAAGHAERAAFLFGQTAVPIHKKRQADADAYEIYVIAASVRTNIERGEFGKAIFVADKADAVMASLIELTGYEIPTADVEQHAACPLEVECPTCHHVFAPDVIDSEACPKCSGGFSPERAARLAEKIALGRTCEEIREFAAKWRGNEAVPMAQALEAIANERDGVAGSFGRDLEVAAKAKEFSHNLAQLLCCEGYTETLTLALQRHRTQLHVYKEDSPPWKRVKRELETVTAQRLVAMEQRDAAQKVIEDAYVAALRWQGEIA